MNKVSFGALTRIWLCVALLCALASFLSAQEVSKKQKQKNIELAKQTLLYQKGITKAPHDMMTDYFINQVDQKKFQWQETYEKIKTVDEVKKYQKDHIEYFYKQLGPLWDKMPLNAKVTGKLAKKEYRVEKIIFESIPNFYVTGTMFLPRESKFKAPYPGVLVVCGHSFNGKGSDFYQKACALGAVNGLAVFIMDPIDQGERFQMLNPKGKPLSSTVPAHNIVGGGSILVGRNTATFEIWDMIRALDYLQSRKDVIADKLGVMGNSGGGTQTSFIMALDPRVKAAAPACYLCGFFGKLLKINGPQDAEQNIFGQLEFGMDHADYCIMRAPLPTLMCTGTKDMFNIEDAWASFRYAKRIYGRFSMSDHMSLVENDMPHGYYPQLREGGVRWMLRWLAGRDEPIVEDKDLAILTDEEILSVPAPGVLGLKNARTTYDLNRDLAKTLKAKRAAIWKEMTADKAAELIRKTAGIRACKDLPQIKVHEKTPDPAEFVLISDPGIYLTAKTNISGTPKKITLFISDQGRNSEKAQKLFAQKDSNVYAVELRGWGDTQAYGREYYQYKWFGSDGSDYYLAYLLGKNYIALRTDDLLAVAQYLKKKYNAPIELTAEGCASTIALHAQIVEPKMFQSVTLDRQAIPNWNELVEKSPTFIQLTDTIHGVLNYYDTSDLLNLVKNPK